MVGGKTSLCAVLLGVAGLADAAAYYKIDSIGKPACYTDHHENSRRHHQT